MTQRETPFIEFFSPENSYEDVLVQQENAVAACLAGGREKLFLGEHAPVYTCGSSAEEAHLLNTADIPVIKTGRGGKVTYHGPGQLVAYPIFNLNTRTKDLRHYVKTLQTALVNTLAEFNINGEITDDIGVWVNGKKIAAIGVRVRRWVTFHGVALNVNCNLGPYSGIVPCGLSAGVTSMQSEGFEGTVVDVMPVLQKHLLAF